MVDKTSTTEEILAAIEERLGNIEGALRIIELGRRLRTDSASSLVATPSEPRDTEAAGRPRGETE